MSTPSPHAAALQRLAKFTSGKRDAVDAASAATCDANKLSRDADKLGPLAPALAHRGAATAHQTAALAWRKAGDATAACNEVWSRQYSERLAAKDFESAHKASLLVSLKEPIRCERETQKHITRATKHFAAAKGE